MRNLQGLPPKKDPSVKDPRRVAAGKRGWETRRKAAERSNRYPQLNMKSASGVTKAAARRARPIDVGRAQRALTAFASLNVPEEVDSPSESYSPYSLEQIEWSSSSLEAETLSSSVEYPTGNALATFPTISLTSALDSDLELLAPEEVEREEEEEILTAPNTQSLSKSYKASLGLAGPDGQTPIATQPGLILSSSGSSFDPGNDKEEEPSNVQFEDDVRPEIASDGGQAAIQPVRAGKSPSLLAILEERKRTERKQRPRHRWTKKDLLNPPQNLSASDQAAWDFQYPYLFMESSSDEPSSPSSSASSLFSSLYSSLYSSSRSYSRSDDDLF